MGILSFIKGQFIEIIEWLDNTNYTLVYRFPDDDHEIKNGAKLVCRENQAAILINEGQLADVFGPGTHTLSTQNLPILSRLKGWKYGFNSPFKVEIYFVNLRQYVDQKWGTANPVLIRDPEFSVAGRPGRVRIRAFGAYNFKISDPAVFFKEIVGTQGLTTTDSIAEYLKRQLVSKFTVAAGKSDLSVADMAAHYNVLENAVKGDLAEEFGKLGLLLTSFVIENISLPPEIEKALDAAAAQAARGVDNTMAWEGLNVMRDAARNPGAGGASSAGMGMGMGMGMGQMMAQMMGGMAGAVNPQQQFHPQQQQFQQQPQQQQAPADDNSLEAKLRKLKAAFEAELLTEEEYKAKRAKLLEAF
ncbi:SPFH domain-containing protein [Nannocystis bainbridge]|uniref:SPFH domain-containing protein n=1 Tax=Nannocystis bainbridge TaxID=2995303 RepID=A0ABT5DX86_9BACT|nr:SPFH domain-containing protein [Nannocystis bainbridge]MDC0718240.1 SPFH domain-containing protein [Nannocystis bainbridge]